MNRPSLAERENICHWVVGVGQYADQSLDRRVLLLIGQSDIRLELKADVHR